MTVGKLATLMMLALSPLVSGMAAEVNEAPQEIVEIVVTGRQPGPPLWKVSNGDNSEIKMVQRYAHLATEHLSPYADKICLLEPVDTFLATQGLDEKKAVTSR